MIIPTKTVPATITFFLPKASKSIPRRNSPGIKAISVYHPSLAAYEPESC
jgi:hypothetical protein